MNLTLGKRADYSVRAVLFLARHEDEDGRCKARQIAEDMDISENYLPQILSNLVRAAIVISSAGPDGGYALARPASDISLLEVIEAAEGDIRSRECVLRGGPCRWDGHCAVHEPWARAQEAMIGQMRSTTFAEIARIDAALDSDAAIV